MTNGGDLYRLAKISWSPEHLKINEHYAKLDREHIAKTGEVAQRISETVRELRNIGHRLMYAYCTCD